MKTLIFNGSPRKNGNTVAMIQQLCSRLQGEYKIVDAYSCNVSPCVDCRYCWKHPACCIHDEWDEIDRYIRECDNVVLASPIYFSSLTGPLLAVLSRVQLYFSSRIFRKESLLAEPKRGGVILTGGGKKTSSFPMGPANIILREMNVMEISEPVMSLSTDSCPAAQDAEALEKIAALADFLNRKDL